MFPFPWLARLKRLSTRLKPTVTSTALVQGDRVPTLQKLGSTLSPGLTDAEIGQTAQNWLTLFSQNIAAKNVDSTLSLFLPDAYWRDLLALTWDFRTFDSAPLIRQFLTERLFSAKIIMSDIKLKPLVKLQQPYPDVAWILFMFSFTTPSGLGTGVVRLVPTKTGEWKAHTIFTNLDSLSDFPEQTGSLRSHVALSGVQWQEKRRAELAGFEDGSTPPTVLIVGGGHSGLALAARLKYLGVSSLIVERNQKVGDNWRQRYDQLSLHFPVWFDHMPYLPFPATWPLYTPSLKIADWLESYVHTLELNVWTAASVLQASQDPETKSWTVNIQRSNGETKKLVVHHLVFATGIGDGKPNIPDIPSRDIFGGATLHSSAYRNSTPFIGKKVVVIGAGNSGHDVSSDLARDGVDVTMFQRSATYVMNLDKGWKFLGGPLYSEGSPPTEVADILFASMPHLLQENGMAQRMTKAIADNDKETLDALSKVGFRTNLGLKDAGFLLLLKIKGGSHYFDTGASALIANGTIKLKNDAQIARFSETGLVFDDDSEVPADVVIYATGGNDMKHAIRTICGPAVADEQCKPLWGLDSEGEMRGAWRDMGVPGLWYMTGSLQMARLHSKHLALQIKAHEEGLLDRYSLRM